MIRVCAGPDGADASRHVTAALRRSVGMDQALPAAIADAKSNAEITVAVNADEGTGERLIEWCEVPGRKLVVFGPLATELAKRARATDVPAMDPDWALCLPAATNRPTESAAKVRYTDHVRPLKGRPWVRPFARFDFSDEWNNQGYGAIRSDSSIWAIAQWVRLPVSNELASIIGPDGMSVASYAGLFTVGGSQALWFNRPVGPIDSFEWCLVEFFLSSFGGRSHACQPVLNEVPFGADAAVTMRLDCDEDIDAAEPLRQFYRDQRVPFSTAVNAGLLAERHGAFLRPVLEDGGSVLSHSMTHAPAWGGDYASALKEASRSADVLHNVVGARPVNAVSPFHQTPGYAISALVDCGYRGVIGGIIGGDPETVLARGGALGGHPDDFAFHTQQCMLHGDCLLDGGQPMAGYMSAFDLAYESQSSFGYCDHSFSTRYRYGWKSEAARAAAHAELLAYIRSKACAPVFLSEDEMLAFLRHKMRVSIRQDASSFELCSPQPGSHSLGIGVTYRGALYHLAAAGLVLPIGK